MPTIETIVSGRRISTQELLLAISEAVANGETEFTIQASGQHDIGGPLWNSRGNPLHFTVRNPGQRVGAMMLPGTTLVVDGPAPADAGWLNAGGTLVVKGDVGDTAGHCAASGVIYIAGRAGTRSGSLMKHDPLLSPPELWILKTTGSFSFEFFSGGTAVVCGCDSSDVTSVLGDRPCVGMVGGTVYARGPIAELPDDLAVLPLDRDDRAFLDEGLNRFLASVGREDRAASLRHWEEWRKIVPGRRHVRDIPTVGEYRALSWIAGGIFSAVVNDAGEHTGLVGTGVYRLRVPVRDTGKGCRDCHKCELACPENAISRVGEGDVASYVSDPLRCIGCGLCCAVCPNSVWSLRNNDELSLSRDSAVMAQQLKQDCVLP